MKVKKKVVGKWFDSALCETNTKPYLQETFNITLKHYLLIVMGKLLWNYIEKIWKIRKLVVSQEHNETEDVGTGIFKDNRYEILETKS